MHAHCPRTSKNRPTQARCCSLSCPAQLAESPKVSAQWVYWRPANLLVCSYSHPRRALVPTIAQAFPRTFLLIATARSVRRRQRRFLIITRSNRRRRRRRNGRWARRQDGRTIFTHVSLPSAAVVGCCRRLLSSPPSAALLLPAASIGSRRLQLRRPCCRSGEIERPALSGLLVCRPSRRAALREPR